MMVQQKDDELGLSLSLSFPGSSSTDQHNINNNNQTADAASSPMELNLMMPSVPFSLLRNNTWAPDSLDRKMQSCRVERRSSFNGIDVNRLPAATTVVVIDDEAGVSSPNSTLSSLSGNKRSVINERYEVANGEDLLDCSRSEDEDGDNSRKKLRLSKEQSAILEESFKEHNTLNPKQKVALAKRLGLRPRQVEVWFQNRRARTKLKQTEVDCEFLKRCCQTLTEENRKLQKEVQELRALKLSPQFYMQMTPPTTLTMCPSCERVAGPPADTSSIVPSSSGLLTKPAAPPRPNPVSTNQHRLPFNLWASPPVANRPLDALHPQS